MSLRMALYARFAKDPLRDAWGRIGQSTRLECNGWRTFLKRDFASSTNDYFRVAGNSDGIIHRPKSRP
jgi:hypothetical protein